MNTDDTQGHPVVSRLFPSHGIRSGSLLPELLGEPEKNPFGTADVAEPIRVLILDHFADDRRAAFAEPGERVVDVLHGEHDAEVAEGVHRAVTCRTSPASCPTVR